MQELLHIDLLGTFRIQYNGKPVPEMNSPRLQELLTYLILHCDSPRQRQQIALDFWPESPGKQTLGNLRQLLYQLRNAMPESEEHIVSDTNTIQWKNRTSSSVDLIEFEQLLKKAREARKNNDLESEIKSLQEAVPLYRGPLLTYCFEEWIAGKRTRLNEAYLEILKRLAELLEEERRYETAITYAEKLLQHDPCSESACRRLMQLHALNEDRTAVIRTYRGFKQKIRKELEIEPGPKTEELYLRLSKSFSRETGEPASRPVSSVNNGLESGWKLTGRNEEWKSLLETWEKACSGTMQWVLLRGETGIGKSRLGKELLDYVLKKGYATARTRCYEAPVTPGYGPLADWLRSPPFNSGINNLDNVWRDELSRLLPEFSEKQLNAADAEPWQQRRFEEALTHALFSIGTPVMLLLEEVQWCDAETLGWFDFLLNRNKPVPLLVAATLCTTTGNSYANEALERLLDDLRRQRRLNVIELNALDQSQTQELASQIFNHEISNSLGKLIYKETEGNPLFIVETVRELHLLKQLRESDSAEFIPPDQTPSQVRRLPKVVSDVISGRFRYLSEKSRQVLGIAAVAGRGFTLDLVAKVSDIGETELIEALEQLIRQYIIKEEHPEFYNFTHDKIREVAYKELSTPRRRLLHRQIAATLKKIKQNELGPWYARLAFHYERAGDIEKALDHYREAALYARSINTLHDIGMLRHALQLLNTLPEDRDRNHRAFDLTTSLVLSLLQRRTFDSEEVFQLCEQVYELSRDLGKPPPVPIIFTLGIANLISGNYAAAKELGTVLYSLAREPYDSVTCIEGCYLLGLSNRVAGKISESVKWYQEGLDRHQAKYRLSDMQIYNLNGSIILQMETAGSLLLAGQQEAAMELSEKTKRSAQTSGPMAEAYICYVEALHETWQGNEKKVRAATEKFQESNIKTEPMHWRIQTEILQGWSMVARGYHERGIEQIQNGIASLEDLNHTLDLLYYFTLLAESLIAAKKYSEAKLVIDNTKKIINQSNGSFTEPLLLWVEGEYFLAQEPSNPDSARTAFNKALKIARQQGAHLFETRITGSLDRVD